MPERLIVGHFDDPHRPLAGLWLGPFHDSGPTGVDHLIDVVPVFRVVEDFEQPIVIRLAVGRIVPRVDGRERRDRSSGLVFEETPAVLLPRTDQRTRGHCYLVQGGADAGAVDNRGRGLERVRPVCAAECGHDVGGADERAVLKEWCCCPPVHRSFGDPLEVEFDLQRLLRFEWTVQPVPVTRRSSVGPHKLARHVKAHDLQDRGNPEVQFGDRHVERIDGDRRTAAQENPFERADHDVESKARIDRLGQTGLR